ncbi:MAG: M48 family metalloprotease [Candidatus Aenigmarchaeota archaeon]|nr:M48 family metalloprotease [Candidatus Aenigmarchaeota archaeon]
MAIGCFAGFIVDIDKLILTAISLSLAVSFLFAIKKFDLSTKAKVGLIYGHLTLLFFPFVLFTTNFACGAACMPCYTDSALSMVSYSLPSALLLATLAGFVVIPAFYTFSSKRQARSSEIISFVKKYSSRLKIKAPKIYIIDKAKPIAFSFKSFRSAIFVSVGMLDLLNKKEIQAVLLHELAHIKQRSSLLKTSTSILRLFSPLSVLARFHHDTGKEEKEADGFAIRIQGTSRFISSAKRKTGCYH